MSVDSGFVYFNSMISSGAARVTAKAAAPDALIQDGHIQRFPVPSTTDTFDNVFEDSRRQNGNHTMIEDSDEPFCVHSLDGIGAPIVDYEVVGRQETFTVYRIHVVTSSRNWFVFRRYSDFEKLNQQLQCKFPGFKLRLPKKRWFRNNFDRRFIEERRKGLQLYINTLMKHQLLSQSEYLDDFLCISDPPGPYDSIEESRAFCQNLEQACYRLKQKVEESNSELKLIKSQLSQARVQHEVLVSALKAEKVKSQRYMNLYRDLEKRNSFPAITEVGYSPI